MSLQYIGPTFPLFNNSGINCKCGNCHRTDLNENINCCCGIYAGIFMPPPMSVD